MSEEVRRRGVFWQGPEVQRLLEIVPEFGVEPQVMRSTYLKTLNLFWRVKRLSASGFEQMAERCCSKFKVLHCATSTPLRTFKASFPAVPDLSILANCANCERTWGSPHGLSIAMNVSCCFLINNPTRNNVMISIALHNVFLYQTSSHTSCSNFYIAHHCSGF